jgi:hypothetical protein
MDRRKLGRIVGGEVWIREGSGLLYPEGEYAEAMKGLDYAKGPGVVISGSLRLELISR